MHGLKADPTPADRMQRLYEQVAWVDHNQSLHRVRMFFDAMPSSGWRGQDKKRK